MISIKDLMTRSPWQIAEENGIHYKGIHKKLCDGGVFFDVTTWDSYGYACAVKILSLGEQIEVQSGTVDKLSDEGFKLACKHSNISSYDQMDTPSIITKKFKVVVITGEAE